MFLSRKTIKPGSIHHRLQDCAGACNKVMVVIPGGMRQSREALPDRLSGQILNNIIVRYMLNSSDFFKIIFLKFLFTVMYPR